MSNVIPTNEAERLRALRQCGVLDTPPEDVYDHITRLAAQVCGVPMATITLIDQDRHWFKSAVGMDAREGPREAALCAHTILQSDILVVPDAARDDRFRDNPSVTGSPGIGFYAGVPLVTPDGFALGSLCVIDRAPRRLDPQQKSVLKILARQVADDLETRRRGALQGERTARQRMTERRLSAGEDRLQLAAEGAGVEGAGAGSYHWDLARRDVFWSDGGKALFGLLPGAASEQGRILEMIHPDDRAGVAAAMRAALDGGPDYDIEARILRPDGGVRWIGSRGHVHRDERAVAVSIEGVVFDITGRKIVEEAAARLAGRERLSAGLAERARRLTDPDEVIADAVRSVGEFLGVSRCTFADIDMGADACVVWPDFRADGAVASMAGIVPISAFGPHLAAEFRAGRAVAVDDVRADRARVPAASLGAYAAAGIRAFIAAPVAHSARVVSCLAVHSATPRRWTPEEAALLQTVAERTWLTVDALRRQRVLARQSEALHEAHTRTAGILESITDAFCALDADWRVTYANDQAGRLMSCGRDQAVGRVFWDVFPHLADSDFHRRSRDAQAGQTPVSSETFYPTLDAWLEVRAYPSPGGLSVFFQDVSARHEVETERARLAAREHQIAEQLQASLTPPIPHRVPGLTLSRYYEAALAEAGVGGDFCDVFPVWDGCTALVVGDLTGKGLAAASQVATVRNMLRYALYRARTLSGALEGLNSLLIRQSLLTGFATLFAGTFDADTGVLNYVNCGQEPALVRRAAGGAVERLEPTGPLLGSFDDMPFEERSVALGPGDALAVFTDGLTEVGASRSEMIGVEGVADILAGGPAPDESDGEESVAERLVRRVIAGIDAAAAGGVVRDDMCLLVAVAE